MYENIVGKGENAGDQHFILFPQCFLPFPKLISILHSCLFCCLQILLILPSLKFYRLAELIAWEMLAPEKTNNFEHASQLLGCATLFILAKVFLHFTKQSQIKRTQRNIFEKTVLKGEHTTNSIFFFSTRICLPPYQAQTSSFQPCLICCLTLSQKSPGFFCSNSLLKTPWEKDKLLVTSNFSFSDSVFYPLGELPVILIKSEIVICKVF